MYSFQRKKPCLLVIAIVIFLSTSARLLRAETGTCNGGSVTIPFTDVPSLNIFFCSVASAFFSGLSNGTSATTYSPSANVTRDQMAAFITRTLDQSLKICSDGINFWVALSAGNSAPGKLGRF